MGKGGRGDEFGHVDASEGLLCTVLHPIEYNHFGYINHSDCQPRGQYRGWCNECNGVIQDETTTVLGNVACDTAGPFSTHRINDTFDRATARVDRAEEPPWNSFATSRTTRTTGSADCSSGCGRTERTQAGVDSRRRGRRGGRRRVAASLRVPDDRRLTAVRLRAGFAGPGFATLPASLTTRSRRRRGRTAPPRRTRRPRGRRSR